MAWRADPFFFFRAVMVVATMVVGGGLRNLLDLIGLLRGFTRAQVND